LKGFAAASVRMDSARDAQLLSLIAIGSRGESKNLDQALERLTTASNPS
jgi:hypothetical protein